MSQKSGRESEKRIKGADKMANPRQIHKYQTSKYLLEALDFLQPADVENASHLHHKYSRIRLVGLDYSKGTGDSTVTADINLDAGTVKYITEVILHGNYNPKVYSEQKILSHTRDESGMAKVTAFNIMYDSSRNYCWQVSIENGVGVPQKHETGGIALQKGTYKKLKQVNIYMNDIDMKKFFIKVRDYVNTWETVHMRALLNARENAEVAK